ncbi:tRNA nucleotidyltransferase [Pseudoalteromonas piscicida]|uniref:tRNA nucleotidyltransferase n=1 Tax=Pseudoalteromonas piscicida TaxID=43662 RepID=A0AAD0RI55_PSEO7|nr:tRNA nucleotidyltransferase [Pseudoalteromonas piscicida]ASD66041.1 tRNA nucleotidyltransferase [Pseudoalteromonas piscicida]AXQ96967.1 tRNA nucleotidyltransferase [Pseudoalteromonas piscicida]AXR03257.1 tRNA nucleotidyltransferase [Pseudoalteromonas piscicida]
MKIYLVGGAVRDELLGRPIKERDYVVVGSTLEQMIKLGYQQVGNDFPVFLHPTTKDEHALARTERKSGQGYTGFICDFGPEITLEEDLLRRDLTVNAIAKDDDGSLIDPYGGKKDIESRVLRHVSSAFSEDPLRVLRVARFAARYKEYNFTIATETWHLMQTMVANGELQTLTKERIWLEIEKTIQDKGLGHFLHTVWRLDALDAVTPYLPKWDQAIYDKFQNALSRLEKNDAFDGLAQFSLACYFSGTCLIQLEQAKQFKVPNVYIESSKELITNLDLLSKENKTSDDWLIILQNIDVWRRPEKLERFCYICSKVSDNFRALCDKLTQNFLATRNIDVQEIIAEGYQGKAIQEQLNLRRLKAIQK